MTALWFWFFGGATSLPAAGTAGDVGSSAFTSGFSGAFG